MSTSGGRLARGGVAALVALCGWALAAPDAQALPGPPIPSATSVSAVTMTSAKLEAAVNPNEKKTTYFFQYIPLATWKADGEQFGEGTLTTPFAEAEGSTAIAVAATLTELQPATAYRARLFAESSKGEVAGEDALFATYAPPLTGLPDSRAYEQASPIDKDGGDAIGQLPLVKASPSGDAITFASTSGIPGGAGAQELPLFLARRGASGWSTRGLLPPAVAGPTAQVLGWTPGFAEIFSYAGRFGTPNNSFAFFGQPGEGGPLTEIAPYGPQGDYAYAGASGDGSEIVFESSASLGSPAGIEGASNVYAWDRETGAVSLISVSNDGEAAKGAFAGPYSWANGTNAVTLARGGSALHYYTQDTHAIADDGSTYFTEAGTGQLYLRLNPTHPQSAVINAGEADEECTEPQKACTIHVSASEKENGEGPEDHDAAGSEPAAFMAASKDGSTAFFTSHEKLTDDATTGPEPKPAAIGKAKLNGSGAATEEDPGFLAARGVGIAVSGDHVYWANPLGHSIGRATLDGSGNLVPGSTEPEFILAGETEFETHPETEPGVMHSAPSTPRYVAVEGGYVYWTNTGPRGGDFLGHPRSEEPILNGAGTIGRAALNGSGDLVPESIEPEFITGASNPQGIAANSTHIYWANNSNAQGVQNPGGDAVVKGRISRAELSGGVLGEVESDFFEMPGTSDVSEAVALDGSYVYWGEDSANNSSLNRVPLEGGAEEFDFIGQGDHLRGLALDGSFIYWAAQKDGTAGSIGRLALSEFGANTCSNLPTCDREFISPLAGSLNGLAIDGERLYFSTNGETSPNPGNDLYRYSAAPDGEGRHLTDLSVDEADPNGAEAQGVLGANADGTVLYFVANGVLSGTPNEAGEAATAGDCHGSPGGTAGGSCNLYRWEEDGEGDTSVAFVARLDADGTEGVADWVDWGPLQNVTVQKESFLSADGRTLLFRSQEQLTEYANEGTPELYRYRVGEGIACVSCNPTGAGPLGVQLRPRFSSIAPSTLPPPIPAALASRNLSADGNRAFFESTEALAADDPVGSEGCPVGGSVLQGFPACRDVYEWEAPGTGSCKEGSPGFSPLNGGCLYLLSDGQEAEPSFFADASESGDDAFIFTRAREVGQDKDQLLDVYDLRVGGGIASQSPEPPPTPCEAEGCREGAPGSPQAKTPATAGFKGPGNVHKAPRCPKGKKLVRRKGKARCAKPRKGRSRHGHKHKRNHRHHRRAQR